MQTNIDIQQLRDRLIENPPVSVSSCIFRVPSKLRVKNEHLFEPYLVSIGPYHRDVKKFQFTEKIKLWYLNCLIVRAPTASTNLERLYSSIADLVDKCFEAYGDEVKMERKEFIEMLVIDGCFIIEFFRRYANMVETNVSDPMFNMPCMQNTMKVDLLLLENQVPWFVLDCLFKLTSTDDERSGNRTLPWLAHKFFYWDALRTEQVKNIPDIEYKHLLDLQRNFLLSGSDQVRIEAYGFIGIPCVSQLLQAGVRFAVGDPHNLLTMTFNNGVLTIPPIAIANNTESFLRNLIAYEQCNKSLQDRITAYAAFLDYLINSSNDLEYLREKNIIKCVIAVADAAPFFDHLYLDAHVVHYPFKEVSKEINKYYKSRWPRWRTKLVRDYFSSPWSFASFGAAVAILVFTFLQTLYSMLYH